MSRIIGSKSRSAALTAFVVPLACLTLAACGGSSSTSSSSSNAASTTAATTSPSAKAGAVPGPGKRFSALRECLQKAGITLPKRTPGQPGGFLAGGGPQLPKGVTRAQYEAAIKKCGGFAGGRPRPGGPLQGVKSPAFTAALTKFAACMRENGVNVPAPNTSGKGPIFSTKGLNPASAKFKAAQVKCASVLRSSLRAQPGAGGAPTG